MVFRGRYVIYPRWLLATVQETRFLIELKWHCYTFRDTSRFFKTAYGFSGSCQLMISKIIGNTVYKKDACLAMQTKIDFS